MYFHGVLLRRLLKKKTSGKKWYIRILLFSFCSPRGLVPVFDNIGLSTADGGLNAFESYVNSSKNFISPSLVSLTHAIMSTPLIGLNNSLPALVSRNKSSLGFQNVENVQTGLSQIFVCYCHVQSTFIRKDYARTIFSCRLLCTTRL